MVIMVSLFLHLTISAIIASFLLSITMWIVSFVIYGVTAMMVFN
ncbi:hypothetical protein [Pontibacillus salipaludis]|nr:hypothetical protein [Pontibacillus salipaludis]